MNEYLFFGSYALTYWYPGYSRAIKDIDVITKTCNIIQNDSLRVEYHWTTAFEYLLENNKSEYVEPNYLFTIKFSHLIYDINFFKHMKDFIYLRDKGCIIDEYFLKLLRNDWENIHRKKRVNLNCSNTDFFKPNIPRIIDHDEIHEALKFTDIPMNFRIRKDLNSPKCYKELFDKLTEEEKLILAKEELLVLTAERNNGDTRGFKHSLTMTLKNMIVSSTSGYFNDFLIFNFDKLLNQDYKEEINKINLLFGEI